MKTLDHTDIKCPQCGDWLDEQGNCGKCSHAEAPICLKCKDSGWTCGIVGCNQTPGISKACWHCPYLVPCDCKKGTGNG